ncbi:hypothetical protein J6590_066271 [Homalodisca vitripennis]|nr:hypothetical protein J6590_066271 [Homalodisca vitripennis]
MCWVPDSAGKFKELEPFRSYAHQKLPKKVERDVLGQIQGLLKGNVIGESIFTGSVLSDIPMVEAIYTFWNNKQRFVTKSTAELSHPLKKTLTGSTHHHCKWGQTCSRSHERVQLVATNRMNRPARSCYTTRQLPPGTSRCGYSGNHGNVAQFLLAAPRSWQIGSSLNCTLWWSLL